MALAGGRCTKCHEINIILTIVINIAHIMTHKNRTNHLHRKIMTILKINLLSSAVKSFSQLHCSK